jgi:integrase/recombinase XerC
MSRHLFRVGKVWHYRFQINGARVQRSTNETVKRRAEPIAEKAYRNARLWARSETPIPTLHELVGQWLEIHAPTASPAHVKIIETFGRLHLYDLADVMLDELKTELVERARNAHLKDHAPATVNQWIRVLKLLCNWAVRRQVIPALPFSIKQMKLQKRPRATLPADLGLQWLAAIDLREGKHLGVRTAVRLMLGLGLREVETITARWEWFDWIRQAYTPGITKGREADPLPVPDWLADYLRPLRAPIGLIVTRPNGKPFARGFTRNAMLAANATVSAGHITAHRLRGTFATSLSEAGVPIQSVQRAMRHKSALTTMAYLESDLRHVAEGQRRVSDQFGFTTLVQSGGERVASDTNETHTR